MECRCSQLHAWNVRPAHASILSGVCPHEAARASSGSSASVSEVGQRHGFRHLSRPAVAYRTLFGELPSHTLLPGPIWRASAIDGVRRNYCSVTELTWRAVDLWIVGV